MNRIWIARDRDGVLCAFLEKPERDKRTGKWQTDEEYVCGYCVIEESWFSDLGWGDNPIELTITGKEEK